MAALPRFYKNNIVEGKGILVFSIVFAVLARLVFFLSADNVTSPVSDGYLWQPLIPVFQNSLLSLLFSSATVAGLAVLVAHINTTHLLIRKRTILPSVIIILLFSCHPIFIQMSSAYLGVLTVMFIISILFAVYNSNEKSIAAFRTTFILSFGSLFAPVLLVYIPLLWIALAMMRCFSFKSILASGFGFFIIYFPAFSFYLFSDNLEAFYTPFVSAINLKDFPFFGLSSGMWGILAFFVLLLIAIIFDNYINRHKDKIRVRAYLSLLNFTVITAILLSLFLAISPEVNLYIAIGVGSLLLSHFFALVETRGGAILFYFMLLLYFLVCILSFMTIL